MNGFGPVTASNFYRSPLASTTAVLGKPTALPATLSSQVPPGEGHNVAAAEISGSSTMEHEHMSWPDEKSAIH